jgi:hypothetical protein
MRTGVNPHMEQVTRVCFVFIYSEPFGFLHCGVRLHSIKRHTEIIMNTDWRLFICCRYRSRKVSTYVSLCLHTFSDARVASLFF